MVNSSFIKEMTGRYPQLKIVESEIQSLLNACHIVGVLMKGFEHKVPPAIKNVN